MADDQHPIPSRTDYTVKKGEVSLALYRKHVGLAPGQPPRPILFLVHGSSNSALSSFDLTVPGAGEYSTMNVFADLGFDVWTMDHENYGRSSRTAGKFGYCQRGRRSDCRNRARDPRDRPATHAFYGRIIGRTACRRI